MSTVPNLNSTLPRREFLRVSSAGMAALATGSFAVNAAGANERLNIGFIGTGSRASEHIGQVLGLADKQNLQITALCDVWKKNLRAAAARVKERSGSEPRQLTRFQDLLDLKDVDAVVIATPDFSHAPILVAALKANKDVYIEKPMSIDLPMANQAFDLARTKDRVVQVGTQYRSDGRYQGATEWLSGGELGTISRVSVAVNFNEERWLRDVSDCQEQDVDWDAFLLHLGKRPFDPKLLRRWQLYRACTNGMAGLWMSHYSDLTHMLTGAQYPRAAVALGGIYVWKDGREHTDTFHALVDYPEGFLMDWAMGLGNSAGNHFSIHGTKGTLDLQNWTISNAGGTEKNVASRPVPTKRGASHVQNWVECIRSRQKPNADIQYGHQHVVATIMAAKALETGRRQKYDASRRAIIAA